MQETAGRVSRRGIVLGGVRVGAGALSGMGAAVAGASLLNACVSGPREAAAPTREGPVTLQFWVNSEATVAYSRAYEERTTDVRVETTVVGDYTDLAEKALASVAAGTAPHVSILGQRHGITQLADGGALLDVDALLTKAERADFYPQFIEKFTYRGKLRALPFQSSVPVLYWNKELFATAGLDPERPPATWDEHLDAGRKLARHSVAGDTAQWGHVASSGAWYFYALVWQNGGEVVDGSGLPKFQEAPGIEAAQWWQDWVHKYRIMPPGTRNDATKDFGSGRAAMMQASQVSRVALDRAGAVRYGVAFLPQRKAHAVSIGGNALGVFKASDSRSPAEGAAWRFVNWLTGADTGARIVEETGYLPLRRSTVQVERLKAFFRAHPYTEVPIRQLQHLRPHPIQRADELMWVELDKALTTLEKDPSVNPRAPIEAVAAQIRQLLAR